MKTVIRIVASNNFHGRTEVEIELRLSPKHGNTRDAARRLKADMQNVVFEALRNYYDAGEIKIL